jgi:superfamily II DNA or RNA helicase
VFVVHAVWQGDALCVWAEDSAEMESTATRATASVPETGRPRPHPYAVPAGVLATAMWDLGPVAADLSAKAAEGEVTLLLPGTGSGPQSSPELGTGTGTPTLARWRVPALCFDPHAALELLDHLDGSDEMIVGADLRYFAIVAGDAVDAAGRGRVLPTLAIEDGLYAGRWRPVLTGAAARRFRELASAMPPVCRATGSASTDLLLEALNSLVDAAVRRTMPGSLLAVRRGREPRRIPFAERWVESLTGHDARAVADDDDEADRLEADLADWFATAHRMGGAATVSFRLAEPGADSMRDPLDEPEEEPENTDTWRVHFALQAADDPSLMVSARDIWGGERLPGVPGRPDDALLTGLGRAARLWPGLTAALRTARPESLGLDTAEAFAFLKETAPLLRAAGFGMLLPAWAGKSRLGLKLTTRSAQSAGSAAGSSGFGLAQLVDFRWDLAIGDETIDADELAELARLKVPLVRVRGQWVELDDRQLKSALDFMDTTRRTGTMSTARVIREVVLGGADDLPLVEVDADGRLGDLLSGQADRRLEPIGTPAGFVGTLRPYQERGLTWLGFLGDLGLGAVLADDMGLGKSPQTLALLAGRTDGKPTLLVCPMSLVGNWQREAAKFTPGLTVYVHHGGGRHRGEELAAHTEQADLVITTYGTALRDRDDLAEIDWGRVVCDEAQAIKNGAARQAKAVRSLPADSRIALTGTPVENHLGELWSIMEFANPGLLGTQADFRRRYAVPIERDGDAETSAALKRATGPFLLRRLKSDKTIISDLPDKLEMKTFCNLTTEQASLYQATVEEMLDRIAHSEGIERKGLVLATMAKLKQVCNHPAQLLKDGSRLAGRSGKLARLEELLEELLAEGDRALCFTQYAEFGSMLAPYLESRLGDTVLWLHGGTSKKQRDAMVERFQTDDRPAVFLLSLKAAGTGLNLTAANHVIHIDRWWNPAVEDQATDRAYRIGQTKNVQVRKFVCVGTLEERIDEMIERKKALAESIVGTGEDWLTDLSVAELRDVIELSPEAVSS